MWNGKDITYKSVIKDSRKLLFITNPEVLLVNEITCSNMKCLKILRSTRIYQCNFGHSICHLCKEICTECPKCGHPFVENIRNIELEEYIDEIHEAYMKHNRKFKPILQNVNVKYDCQMLGCNSKNLAYCNLILHLRTKHVTYFEELQRTVLLPQKKLQKIVKDTLAEQVNRNPKRLSERIGDPYCHSSQFVSAFHYDCCNNNDDDGVILFEKHWKVKNQSFCRAINIPPYGIFFIIILIEVHKEDQTSIVHGWIQSTGDIFNSSHFRFFLTLRIEKLTGTYTALVYENNCNASTIRSENKCLNFVSTATCKFMTVQVCIEKWLYSRVPERDSGTILIHRNYNPKAMEYFKRRNGRRRNDKSK